MIFTTPLFLFLFLPAMLASLYPTRRLPRVRNALLLAFSLLFYAWGEGVYLLLLLTCIGITFVAGRALGCASAHRRVLLGLGVGANLAILLHFKYRSYLAEGLAMWLPLDLAAPEPTHLPVGLSFFTFQAISYLVDVYRREAEPRSRPMALALYISLFPQLLAGPIVRYVDIDHQLDERRVELSDLAEGIRRFIFGLAKKVLIADQLAAVVDPAFGLESQLGGGLHAWLAVGCYTLQIYFDFSGYSDMAIGLGRMLGFRFRENFNFPYVSRSLSEFWRRWHISLSTWFRDYVYLPLGGNRHGTARTVRSLWIVFLLCGLWHGASSAFLAWGAYHGLVLSLERLGRGRTSLRLPPVLLHFYTMFVVMLGWVIFRSPTLFHAGEYLATMFGQGAVAAPSLEAQWFALAKRVDNTQRLAFVAGWVIALDVPAMVARRLTPGRSEAVAAPTLGHELWMLALLAASVLSVASTTFTPFVYFRF